MSFFSNQNGEQRRSKHTNRTRTKVRDLRPGDPLYSSDEIVESDKDGHPVTTTDQIFGRYGCGHEFGEDRPPGASCAACGLTLCLPCEQKRECQRCSKAFCRDHAERLKNPDTGDRDFFCLDCIQKERRNNILREIWRALTASPGTNRPLISKD